MIHNKINLPALTRVVRFALVGCAAAVVNMLVVFVLVEGVHMPPLAANVFAFLVAFWVSYFGHSLFTFRHLRHNIRHAAPRFFIIALTSLLLNEGLYFLLLHFTALHYLPALLIVLAIVPVFTFVAGRAWAFNGKQPVRQ